MLILYTITYVNSRIGNMLFHSSYIRKTLRINKIAMTKLCICTSEHTQDRLRNMCCTDSICFAQTFEGEK
jgi:hypothetical protein